MTTTAIGASRVASERRSGSEFVQSNECEGSGVRIATIANLTAKGLVTQSGGLYRHETRGLFGRGNWRSRYICCWTAEITDAGRAVLAALTSDAARLAP